jgi:hypothetical protein
MVHGMSYRTLLVVGAASLLVPLAGCDRASSADQQAPQAPPATSSTAPSAAPVPKSAAPIVGLRPMTAQEKQQREYCQQRVVKNGCKFYTDNALRLQGIDPNS